MQGRWGNNNTSACKTHDKKGKNNILEKEAHQVFVEPRDSWYE
jgi:hypothetical protein